MVNEVNSNTFLGIAANGCAAIATRGVTVASAVAIAIVWNDDIGPILGQPKEKRNALLGRLERRLIDKGMKAASIETWRKHGIKFATLYGADIERIINSIRSDETKAATGVEYVNAVTTWARNKFPTLTEFHDELYAREAKAKVAPADKERAAQLAILLLISKAKGNHFLDDIYQVITLRSTMLSDTATVADKAVAETTLAAILLNYKPDDEHKAEQEMDAAPSDDTNIVPISKAA